MPRAIIAIDAEGRQKAIAGKIVDGGGNYVLSLNANQGNLHKSVADSITEQNGFVNVTARKYWQTVKGHQRLALLTYYQFGVPKTLPGFSNWKEFPTIRIAIRVSKKGDKETRGVR